MGATKYSLAEQMLDGDLYYAAFPDENPEIRLRIQTLSDLLKKLDKESRPAIEQFSITRPDDSRPQEL